MCLHYATPAIGVKHKTLIKATLVLVIFSTCIIIQCTAEEDDEDDSSEDNIDEDESETYTSRSIKVLEQGRTIDSYEDLLQRVGPFTEPTEIKRHTNQEVIDKMKQLSTSYPHITFMYEIGLSVEGWPLSVLAIGKYPREHYPGVPEFKYVGGIHGNEIASREALLLLAEALVVNYGKNEMLTRLINSTRIHLLPTMNPDGYERAIPGNTFSAWVQGRNNAHSKDLNRNFPDRLHPDEYIKREPETIAVMNWTKSLPFVLSANLHAGVTIVSFPYDDGDLPDDVVESPTPDHDLFIFLSYTYARAHKWMWQEQDRCMQNNVFVSEAVINGYAWFASAGSMQDWNYVNTNCFEITIEMNCAKMATDAELRNMWDESKFALISFIEKVHWTIHGFVSDSVTRVGIPDVRISIGNKEKVVTSSRHGDYWRLIKAGTYNVTFQHPSYQTATEHIVADRARPHACVNVLLEKKLEKR